MSFATPKNAVLSAPECSLHTPPGVEKVSLDFKRGNCLFQVVLYSEPLGAMEISTQLT